MRKMFTKICFVLFMSIFTLCLVGCNEALVSEITITGEKTMYVGETQELAITILPSDAEKSVVWSSSDNSIATCESGKVSALKEGVVTITLKSTDESGKEASFEITISEAPIDSIIYTITVTDLDGEVLGSKTIVGEDGDNVFEALKENFDVNYTEFDYGPYITSINNSIVDPNYYLNVKENGVDSMVSCDKLVANNEDNFEFTNICWNSSFDETDLLIDKIIYSFMKETAPTMFNESKTFYDYYITASVLKMIEEGYDANIFNFDYENKNTMKEALEGKDWTAVTNQNDYFKGLLTMIAVGADPAPIKEALSTAQSYNDWSLICTKYFEMDNVVLQDKLDKLVLSDQPGDGSLMVLLPKLLYYSYTDINEVDDSLMNTYALANEDGVDYYGVNCSSTALTIVASCALGKNPKELTVGETNLLSILLKYYNDGAFKWKLEQEVNDLSFSTPNAFAALVSYKIYRDKNTAVNIFDLGE